MTQEESPASEHHEVILSLGCSPAPAPAVSARFTQAEGVLEGGQGYVTSTMALHQPS